MGLKKKPTKREKMTQLFLYFAGEYVQVMTNLTSAVPISDGDFIEAPYIVEGFLVDMDDLFVYIGNKPDTIGQAIRLETVVSVLCTEQTDPYEELLMASGTTPGSENEVN